MKVNVNKDSFLLNLQKGVHKKENALLDIEADLEHPSDAPSDFIEDVEEGFTEEEGFESEEVGIEDVDLEDSSANTFNEDNFNNTYNFDNMDDTEIETGYEGSLSVSNESDDLDSVESEEVVVSASDTYQELSNESDSDDEEFPMGDDLEEEEEEEYSMDDDIEDEDEEDDSDDEDSDEEEEFDEDNSDDDEYSMDDDLDDEDDEYSMDDDIEDEEEEEDFDWDTDEESDEDNSDDEEFPMDDDLEEEDEEFPMDDDLEDEEEEEYENSEDLDDSDNDYAMDDDTDDEEESSEEEDNNDSSNQTASPSTEKTITSQETNTQSLGDINRRHLNESVSSTANNTPVYNEPQKEGVKTESRPVVDTNNFSSTEKRESAPVTTPVPDNLNSLLDVLTVKKENIAVPVDKEVSSNVNYHKGMRLDEFLRANPSIRGQKEVSEYYCKEDIQSAIKYGLVQFNSRKKKFFL